MIATSPRTRIQAPAPGEPNWVKIGDKTYYYCQGHGAHDPKWVVHKPEQCRGLKNKKKDEETKPKGPDGVGMLATTDYASDEE